MKISELDPVEVVLDILKDSEYPVSIYEIQRRIQQSLSVQIRLREIENLIDLLIQEGYDIKTLQRGKKKFYVLVRFGELDSQSLYRPLGRFSYPLLLTGDWHIGSTGFSLQAFQVLSKDIEEYGVRDIIHTGDLIQGRGVYRLEMKDLLIPCIDEQEEIAIELLNSLGVNIHLVIGNHEEKLKGMADVLHDSLRVISKECEKVNYYGTAAKLMGPKGKSLLFMHSSGSPTYALSYRPQKIFESLIEKADILALGHRHQLLLLSMPGQKLIIECGTLQRESSFLIWRGITPELGWIILNDFDGKKDSLVLRRVRTL